MYACKALSNISVLKLLREQGAGIDAVSINEVQFALKAGFLPQDMIFTPNGVSHAEIQTVVELGVHVNIDNLPALEWFGKKYGNTVPVCVRINPHIQAGGNKNIQVGGIDSKFGISHTQLSTVHKLISTHNLRVQGLHVHTRSEILETRVFLTVAQLLFDIAHFFPGLEYIDSGSGFKVAYQAGDAHTNVEELRSAMSNAFSTFCETYGREIEMWFEPGKYVAS